MALPFAWMYRDPAEVHERMEELRPMLKRGEEMERRNKARLIRKLTKLAKAGKLKGQR